MVELVKYIAQSLVEKPEAVDVRQSETEEGIVVELRVEIVEPEEAARAKTDRVAINTAAAPDRSVDVRARKMSVDADLADDAAKFAFKIGA